MVGALNTQKYSNFMRSVRTNLLALERNLENENYEYEFSYGPVDDPNLEHVEETIRLFSERQIVVPPAILSYYSVFGAVEFSGPVPQQWTGCHYPDPISIAPFDPGYIEGEFELWEELREDIQFEIPGATYAYMISGDHIHKAGFSGGCYYLVFDRQEDAVMLCNDKSYRFCDYLRLCIKWSGFPGLRHETKHNWPIERLKTGFKELEKLT